MVGSLFYVGPNKDGLLGHFEGWIWLSMVGPISKGVLFGAVVWIGLHV